MLCSFWILVGFICAAELIFISLLSVCVVSSFCNVQTLSFFIIICLSVTLVCFICRVLMSVHEKKNLVLQDDVTPFKDKYQQMLNYCEISIYKQL